MKIGSAVLGLHIVAVVVFSLTQGCVTPETQGSGTGIAASHKGPWKHKHKGKSAKSSEVVRYQEEDGKFGSGEESIIDTTEIVSSQDSGSESEYVGSSSSSSTTETYIVKKGDILGRIAIKFDTTVQTLVDLNNLSNKDVLYVGQELQVPAGRGASSSSTTTSKSTATKGADYTIQKGDTLSSIATAANVSIDDLRAINNIKGDKIIAGETISIPSGGKVPSNTKNPKEAEEIAPAPAPAPVRAPEPEVEQPPVLEPTSDIAPAPESNAIRVIDHVVYPGDTLASIAAEHVVSKNDILRYNPQIKSEADIKQGVTLRIPISD